MLVHNAQIREGGGGVVHERRKQRRLRVGPCLT
jgi:hypothetical protein